MKHLISPARACAAALISLSLANANAAVVTFEDLPFGAGNSHEFPWDGDANAGFTANGVHFNHDGWSGFAYSRETDTTTPGYVNQYSAFTGGGANGSASYAVGHVGGNAIITYSSLTDLNGTSALITNTTYTALSMLDGDTFAKKFGGVTGTDEDWLVLTITGYAGGDATGTVDFYLADFRGPNSYIIDEWTEVDFSALGTVDELRFTMDSSDQGAWGMNTPGYFAIDNLPIPEPSAWLLSLTGLGLILRRQRR